MAISLLAYDMFSAAQNVSESINIHANTDYILIWLNGYSDRTISNVQIDGSAVSLIVNGSAGSSATYLYGLVNPTTGAAVSLTASVSSAFDEGAIWGYACFSGVDTADPIRDSDTSGAASGGTTVILDCVAGDYCFLCTGGDSYGTLTANITVIQDLFELAQHGRMAGDLVASGTSITVGTTTGDYSTNCAATLKEVAVGGTPIPVFMHHMKQQNN